MYRFPLLVLLLTCCALLPAGTALAQKEPKDAKPQVVEPKAGEAVPAVPEQQVPPVTTPPAGTTGPDAVVPSTQVAPGAVTGPTGPTGPSDAVTGPAGPQESVTAAKKSDSSDDTWLAVAAAGLAGLLLALLVTSALWRWRGWDPRWRKRWRHATAEANLRLGLGWAEFRDFLRLGR